MSTKRKPKPKTHGSKLSRGLKPPVPYKAVWVPWKGLACIPTPHFDICTDEKEPKNYCCITNCTAYEAHRLAAALSAFEETR